MKFREYLKEKKPILVPSNVLAYEETGDDGYTYILFWLSMSGGREMFATNTVYDTEELRKLSSYWLDMEVEPNNFKTYSGEEFTKRKKEDIRHSLKKYSESNKRNNYKDIRDDIMSGQYGGRNTFECGKVKKVVAVVSSDEDFYYVLCDADLNLSLDSCVGRLVFPEEIQDNLELNQTVEDNRDAILSKIDAFPMDVCFADIWRGEIKFQ